MTVNIVQEVVVKFDDDSGEMLYHVKYNDEGNKNYTAGDAFRLAMLQFDMEEGDVLIKSVVKMPELKKDATEHDAKRAFQPILAWLNNHNVLTAYTTGDSTFAVVRVVKDGTFRKWGEFHAFEFNGMEQKAMKRQGMFGTQVYAFGSKRIEFVTDDAYHAPRSDVWTVKIVETPDWLELAVDGVLFGRDNVRNELVFDALDRQDDEDRRMYLEDSLLSTRKFNVRFTMPRKSAKGDIAFCRQLNTDFVIHDCNLYTFIRSSSEMGYITITPQEQMTSIRTNRQSIAHFWDLLFSVPTPGRVDTQGLVKDAMRDMIDRESALLKSGQPLSHIEPGARDEDDAIRSVQSKVLRTFRATDDLNEFPHLVAAQAAQFRDMYTPRDPDEQEKKRTRLPIPHWAGMRASINSEFVYAMVYGERLNLESGECMLVDELGLVVNDHDWDLMLEVLGGADQDDHVEIHSRRVVKRETWMGRTFLEGDIIFFLVRSPIGLSSDGENLYSEYFILKPEYHTRARVLEAANYTLPGIDLTSEADGGHLPLCTAEMDDELRRSGRQPTKRELPETYTKEFFVKTVFGLMLNRLVYDSHSAIMRKHRILGIPFEFKASEDFFIDTAAQFMNPEDLAFIRRDNDEARGRLPDPMPHTIMDEIVQFHTEQIERFMRTARLHLTDIATQLRELHSDVEMKGIVTNGKPLFLHWVDQAEQKHRGRINHNRLYARDFEIIGNNMASGIELMVNSDEFPEITEEAVRQTIMDARAYELARTKKSQESLAPIERMLTPLDGKLMRGRLVDMVLDAYLS